MRNQDLDGRDWLEVHIHARLARRDINAQEQAAQLAVELDLAIRSIVLPPIPTRPAIVRKGQLQ